MAALTSENLSTEITWTICSVLPNRDVKSLCLTYRAICRITRLRLDRVFLSADPCNIGVLKAVVDHSVLSKIVTDIVWDDARLADGPQVGFFDEENNVRDGDSEPEGACPAWFTKACRENDERIDSRVAEDVLRPSQVARVRQIEEQMPLDQA